MKTTKKITPTSEVEVIEPKEIVAQNNQIANFNVESLMAKAIEHGLSPETMEKFLAMRQQLKAEWAKEQFTKAMASFQGECPTIVKTKGVNTKSGALAYKYAPIESIVEQVKPYLQKNGFSYSTNMEVLSAGVRVVCRVTHIDGHSENSEMEVPLGERTQIMSASQVTAAASTFAKRYAFCNAFGILTGDEDTDARPIENKEEAQHNHGGNIVEKAKDTPASEKQLKLIADLCKQKGYTKEDILDQGFTKLTGGKEGTASELIDFLFKAKTKITPNGQELPVIQQEEMTQDEKALIDSIPF